MADTSQTLPPETVKQIADLEKNLEYLKQSRAALVGLNQPTENLDEAIVSMESTLDAIKRIRDSGL